MKANTPIERLYNGIIKENPTLVLTLGMCPTLAVTTCAINGLGMGLTTAAVLAMSNMFISLLRKVIPDRVRIPAFIVIIASFVTIVELLLKAYIPSLYDALGLYIPLIVVNCIILGRAEAYASKNKVIPSFFDGLGMGLGFTLALTIIGAIRELLGAGTLFDYRVMPDSYVPVSIFIMAPGAFFVLAALTAIQNKIKASGEKKGKDMSKIQSGCGTDCMTCNLSCVSAGKAGNPEKASSVKKADKPEKSNAEKQQDKPETVNAKKKAEKVEKPVAVKNEDTAIKTSSEEKTEPAPEPKALTQDDIFGQEKKNKTTEFFDLDDEIADTIEITEDDINAINDAVEKKEENENADD